MQSTFSTNLHTKLNRINYILKNLTKVTAPDLFNNFSSLHNDACTSVADNSCHFHAVPPSAVSTSYLQYTVLLRSLTTQYHDNMGTQMYKDIQNKNLEICRRCYL